MNHVTRANELHDKKDRTESEEQEYQQLRRKLRNSLADIDAANKREREAAERIASERTQAASAALPRKTSAAVFALREAITCATTLDALVPGNGERPNLSALREGVQRLFPQ